MDHVGIRAGVVRAGGGVNTKPVRSLLEAGFLVVSEWLVADVEGRREVGKWAGIGRERDAAVFGVFGMRAGDADRGADFDEGEEFRGDIVVHADAAVPGAGFVFDPSSVEAVVGFEFDPVGHRSSFE